jgi:DNA-binding transcriptional ArsR family regulator
MSKELTDCFKALSDESRYAVFMAVLHTPGGDRNAITIKAGVSSTVWHHLEYLVKTGLVIKEKQDSKDVRYYVNTANVKHLAEHLEALVE